MFVQLSHAVIEEDSHQLLLSQAKGQRLLELSYGLPNPAFCLTLYQYSIVEQRPAEAMGVQYTGLRNTLV